MVDLHSSGFEIEVAEKQEIAKLGYDIAVIYELVNLEVKIYVGFDGIFRLFSCDVCYRRDCP